MFRFLLILISATFLLVSQATGGAASRATPPNASAPVKAPPVNAPPIAVEAAPPASPEDFGTPDALSYISTLVTIFGVLLTIISIVFIAVSYFGFREIMQIRDLEKKLEELMESSHAAQGEYERAASELRRAVSDFQEKAEALRSEIARDSGKLIEASYYFSLGENAYKRGAFEKAIEEYQNALRFRPSDAGILIRIGRANVNVDRADEARVAFERAIEIDPNNPNAYYGLSTVWRYENQAKAISLIEKAQELAPPSVEILNYSGLLLRDAGRHTEAISSHLRALAVGQSSITHFYLAILYAQLRQTTRAKAEILAALVALDEELDQAVVRPVWAAVVRWAAAVLEGQRRLAKAEWKAIVSLATTARVRRAVSDHASSLSAALSVLPKDYGGIFDVDS